MSLSKNICMRPSESRPLPPLSSIEFYLGKIFPRRSNALSRLRELYDMTRLENLDRFLDHHNYSFGYWFGDAAVSHPHAKHDGDMIWTSIISSFSWYNLDNSTDILNDDTQRCLEEEFDCACWQQTERTQIFHYLMAHIYYRKEPLINIERCMRLLLAIDLCEEEIQKDLYLALKSMLFKLDMEEKLSFKEFFNRFKYNLYNFTKFCKIGYIPDLIMSERPDLLPYWAQSADLVTSQCLSDKIDALIEEVDSLHAQAFFRPTIDLGIPQDTVSSLLKIITELKESVLDILKQAFNFTLSTILFIVYAVVLYVIITRLIAKHPRIVTACVIVCSLFKLFESMEASPSGLVQWAMNAINKVREESQPEELVAQDGEVSTGLLSMLPVLFLKVINPPARVASSLINNKFLDSLARKISFLGDNRFYTGCSTIADWISKGFEAVKSHICSWLGVEYVKDITLDEGSLETWCKKVDDVVSKFNNDKLVRSQATRAYVSNLYQEGCRFGRHPVYKSASQYILSSCRTLLTIIDKINTKLNIAGTLRNPPVTLMLHGDTGAGKSSLTLPLSIAILKEIYIREKNVDLLNALKTEWQTMMYTRNAEQEYWDGYTGQTVCIFDDWNQLVDTSSNPSVELFELIRASNVFPYPLHMAHLEDKSAVNFSSDVIVCSSNNKVPKVESLNFPQALLRRFSIFATVTRVTEDIETGDAHLPGKFRFSSYRFTPYDPHTQKPEAQITIDEFIKRVVDSYIVNKQFVGSINDFVASNLLDFNAEDLCMTAEVDDENLIVEGNRVCSFTASIRSCISKCNIIEKVQAWNVEHSWLNWKNITLVLGAVGLISAGLALYRHFSNKDKTVAESDPVALKEYFSQRKQKRAEAYESQPKPKKVVAEGFSLRWTQDGKHMHVVQGDRIVNTINLGSEAGELKYSWTQDGKDIMVMQDNELIDILTVTPRSEAYESQPKPAKVVSEDDSLGAELCADQVAQEMGSSIAFSNLYRIYYKKGELSGSLGHCLFLRGNLAIMPRHFELLFKVHGPDTEIYFGSPTVPHAFPMRVKDLKFNSYTDAHGREKDLVYFLVPGARNHTDLTNKFLPRSACDALQQTRISLLTLTCSSPKKPLIVDRHYGKGHTCLSRLTSSQSYKLAGDGSTITIHDGWKYNDLETKKGDCGAPLLAVNDRLGPGKILGIHVAGGISMGMSTTLFKEDVTAILSNYTDLKAQMCTLQVLSGTNPYPEEELVYVGELDKPVIQPSQSKIIPSRVHGLVAKPTTARTWLRPGEVQGELFDPLDYRIRRMGKYSVPIPFDLIDLAKEGLLNEFKRVFLPNRSTLENRFKCPYSLEETCCGVDGEDFVNAIKRDTSCGFPFVQLGLDRKEIFGSDDRYDCNTEIAREIFELVQHYEDSADQGIVYDHYFTDTLKDERKPLEKCHKTRMFAACPIDYLIWTKRWFNGIVAIISELRNRIHISVGTNPYSDDWHFLAKQLLGKNQKFVAGDFEGFDASEQAYLLQTACNVLIDFSQYVFGEDLYARRQMEAIISSLVNSFHVSGKYVFQWLKSLPSGHYLTAIVNSVFVLLAISSAFLLARKKQGVSVTILDVNEFWQECDIVAYGDDHILGIPDRYLSFFNQNTLVDLLREFGLYYTDESKSGGEVPDFRPLTDISYLKRKFRYDKDVARYVAPLDLNVIKETPMWIRKCADSELQTFNNLEFSLRELSLHSQEEWDRLAPLLLRLCEEECNSVSKFSNRLATLLFVVNNLECQASSVIFSCNSKNVECESQLTAAGGTSVAIQPYPTRSDEAAPHNLVDSTRPISVGALWAEANSPAESQINEIKDSQYESQPQLDSVEQITAFENDMSVVSQDMPMYTPLDAGITDVQTDQRAHSIISFLKRPIVLREFSWDSAMVRNADVFDSIRIPLDMLVSQFKDKLDNFSSFRATAVITVQFQTQPFQAGRFIMAAIPLPDLIGGRFKFVERLSNLTLLNHVQCDLAKQTECTLRVPYTSPLIAFDLIRTQYNWATVVGKVYSPVSSVGTTSVDGIVYVHFEDVQLGAPSSQHIGALVPTTTPSMEAQAGDDWSSLSLEDINNTNIKEPSPLADVRARAKERGLTSRSFSKVTGGLKQLNSNITKYIPSTKGITDAIAKYLLDPVDDFLGPILNIFGFSKPLVDDDVLLRPSTLYSTFSGADRALTLATSAEINAPYIPGLNGTSCDEMAFDYLKKIPQFFSTFKYSANTEKGRLLWFCYNRPTYQAPDGCSVSFASRNVILPQPSHLAYITSPFNFWTGSFVYTFKFVKTDYHSGRVEISFHPQGTPVLGNGDLDKDLDFDAAYRLIVDLREKSEVSVRVPYIATTPCRRMRTDLSLPNSGAGVLPYEESAVNDSGCIVVRALTSLRAANAVVSNTIDVIVERNAGNDFQVTAPVAASLMPVRCDEPLVMEAQSGESSQAGMAITRQSALEGFDPLAITRNNESRSPVTTYSVTGECFTNFRDLCHRSNWQTTLYKKVSYFDMELVNYLNNPLFMFNDVTETSIGDLILNGASASALTYVSGMYVLFRGSVNVRVYVPGYKGVIEGRLINQEPPFNVTFPLALENASIKGVAEFHVPYYAHVYQVGHLAPQKLGLLQTRIDVGFETEVDKVYIAMSAGDDVQFGTFLGTPLCLTPDVLPQAPHVSPFMQGTDPTNPSRSMQWSDINVTYAS